MTIRLHTSIVTAMAVLAVGVFFLTSSARTWLGFENKQSQAATTNDEIHWTVVGQTAITIDWRGPDNTIRYGVNTTYGQTATAVAPSITPHSSSGPFWEAKLTNLQTNTLYHYSIANGPDHTFRTPPPSGTTFTVATEGDIGDVTSYANVAPVQQLIADQKPNLVLAVGDLTYGNSHGQTHVDQHFNDVMVWSQDAAYMPAWGNHEWDSAGDNLKNYKGRFDIPNPQTSPGSPAVSCCGEDWGWFDYGNTRFITYPEPWSGAWADWNTKVDVLMAQAQADPKISFIITYGHRPPYTSTTNRAPGDLSLRNLQTQLRVNYSKYVINIAGHSHNYERTLPQNGLTHVVVGTGGATLYDFTTQPSSTAFRAKRQGTMKLTISSTGIEGKFLCGPAGGGSTYTCGVGEAIDTFTIGTPAEGCTENWSCGGWSSCTNGTQSRTCTDANACGTVVNRPALNQSCSVGCTESWSCGAWSACSNNSQSRTCTDSNACGTTVTRPPITQSCTNICTENWVCTAWSTCANDQQTRVCTDSNACGTTNGKPTESQSCAIIPPGSQLFFDDFEDNNANGWTPLANGNWNVVTDSSLVYQQTSASGDAWSKAGSAAWTNYSVEAKVKPLTYGTSGFAGLYGRWQDDTHWYYLKITATQIELKKNLGGTISSLGAVPASFPSGGWRTVKLVMDKSTLRVLVDGAQQLMVTDASIVSGQLALGTFNASAKFDDVVASSIGPATAPTAPTNLQTNSASASSLRLDWTGSPGAVAGYSIWRGTVSGGPYVSIGTTSATSYTDTGLSAATTYYYVVRAYDQSQNVSADSNQATGTTLAPPDTTSPIPIQDLSVS